MPTNESDLTPGAEERWTLTDKGWDAVAKLDGAIVVGLETRRTTDEQRWFAQARSKVVGAEASVFCTRDKKEEAVNLVVGRVLKNIAAAVEEGDISAPRMVLVRDVRGQMSDGCEQHRQHATRPPMVGDRVAGRFTGKPGTIVEVAPAGVWVQFDGEAERYGAMLHPQLHLVPLRQVDRPNEENDDGRPRDPCSRLTDWFVQHPELVAEGSVTDNALRLLDELVKLRAQGADRPNEEDDAGPRGSDFIG